MQTSTVGNWTYLADLDDSGTIRHVGSHLACFYGGNWILGMRSSFARQMYILTNVFAGGKLTNNDTIVDIGLTLTEACWNTYAGDA